MFQDFIAFCIRNKLFVLIGVVILITVGTYCTVTLPTDAVPDITNNQVQIVTVSPTLAPQEVEKLITFPIEMSMSNILGVKEIRSVSRFGLSVVTVVFEDRIPILEARQLINEQISTVIQDIPSELGAPQLMPITTGLGEIFQYTLGVKPEYQNKYSIMDLRTIQDWIVKRQLSGIQGIVEISSFGGKLKQYEVAVDPVKLKAFNLTISEVFDALSRNNQNTGGSYIEKYNKAYYIRSEGMITSMDDIRSIVVDNRNGIPVLVSDLATVGEGSAARFGAMTKDGKGECVGGITLMLKGANASQVTKEVNKRVEQIQQMLPEGVYIDPYLIRSHLVERNMGTVMKNLLEGALIVFVVLILFLGNLRIGLIIASIIPLSMLFAFICMRIFGVSANLMSLGAIDFGIVIDGSIILVESVVAALMLKWRGKILSAEQMDTVIIESTGAIAKSAVFSVLIILMVFFPILTLTGIEGKTFTPMAKTLIFAIIGALVLSLSYVPVMLSIFVKKSIDAKKNFSDKLLDFFGRGYAPVLAYALRRKVTVLVSSVLLFVFSLFVFTRMGGEFMPTLDEGDFAMQMTLPPGSSLSESIELSTRAEKVLMEKFHEVKSVVSKIGTAEVPTDPMGVEDADIMIVMNPFEEWTNASSRAEMVVKMKQALEVVVGADFNFSQPIQLRFNELMTGSKADIAIKLYGEDMEELYAKANEAAKLIAGIEGPSDIIVEQAVGLPQLVIQYNREMIARNGLNIEDINTAIRSAYAGESAGVVFEGERRFDLVVRNNKFNKKELDLAGMFVKNAQGVQVPVSEVTRVELISGPMQINRDATKRRIVVGVNVRNADVESVVGKIKEKLDTGIKLQPGYYFTYGGQFENLKNAKERLSIVIPAVLLLILLLLFFTFNSMKYAFLIFSTVPLSVTGGIFALYLRDIPFSISAGVGFIALFGVAVLNGIVMINHYKHMMEHDGLDADQVVEKGSMELLRPVLMTGLVASLGFVPMAISTSAGSEMQRPLATVVIGGLILSTLLTLLIIPVLFKFLNRKNRMDSKFAREFLPVLAFLCLIPAGGLQAQPKEVTFKEVVSMAVENSPRLRNAALEIESQKAGRGQITNFGSTEASYTFGQINDAYKGDYQVNVTQSIGSLLTPFYENKLVNSRVKSARLTRELTRKEVVAEVKRAWYAYLNAVYLSGLYKDQAELYKKVAAVAEAQYRAGAVTLMDKSIATARAAESANLFRQSQTLLRNALARLEWAAFTDTPLSVGEDNYLLPASALLLPDTLSAVSSLYGKIMLQGVDESKRMLQVERSRYFPELFAGYNNQKIMTEKNLTNWQVGVTVPLFFWQQKSKITQSRLAYQKADNNYRFMIRETEVKLKELRATLEKALDGLRYYEQEGLVQADAIYKNIEAQYRSGNIDVTQFVQGMITASDIRAGYYNLLLEYHIAFIESEMYEY